MYLQGTFRHFNLMEGKRLKGKLPITWHELRLFPIIVWRQGVVRSTRFHFWWPLVAIALHKPH
ncbi:DUF4070 domain-containing protein [uncultured Nostoc sp.]|uniref:DUF4070 domain-containing protein n=1 Tax=uncultured Nostoc sp. TaxID=340711 RepID=UPI0035C959EE